MNDKLKAVTLKAEKQKTGLLGVLVPMSLPPYNMSIDYLDMMYEAGVDIFFIPFMVPAVRMPWMMGGTEQIVDIKAYKEGITDEMNWEFISIARKKYPQVPIVVVSFFNDIIAYGIQRFVDKCKENKIDGLDAPGYSYINNGDYMHLGSKLIEADLGLIHPFSTELALAEEGTKEFELLEKMIQAGRGFIFIMTDSAGKSGATGHLNVETLSSAVRRMKEVQKRLGNELPIIAVCGIASNENAKEAAVLSGTDGVMLASGMIRKILSGDSMEEIKQYLKGMKDAMGKK